MIDIEKAEVWIVILLFVCWFTGSLQKKTNHPLFGGIKFLAFMGLVGCFAWFGWGVIQRMAEVATR